MLIAIRSVACLTWGVFLWEHISIFRSESARKMLPKCSCRNTGRVLHTINLRAQRFLIAFEMQSALCCRVALGSPDNLMGRVIAVALNLRRAAWVRLRLPST